MVRLVRRHLALRQADTAASSHSSSANSAAASASPSSSNSPSPSSESNSPGSNTPASSATPASNAPAASTPSSSTPISSQNQNQNSGNNNNPSSTQSQSQVASTSSSQSVSSSSSSVQSQPQTSSLVTTDQSGATKTIVTTVMPTITQSSNSTSTIDGRSAFFKNTPAVIGTFSAIGVLALVILIFFITFSIRRRRERTKTWDRDREVWKKATGIALGMGLNVEPEHGDQDKDVDRLQVRELGEGVAAAPHDDTNLAQKWDESKVGWHSRSQTGSMSETASQGTFGAYDQPPMNASYTFPRVYSSSGHAHTLSHASLSSYYSYSANMAAGTGARSIRSQYRPQTPVHPLKQQHSAVDTEWNQAIDPTIVYDQSSSGMGVPLHSDRSIGSFATATTAYVPSRSATPVTIDGLSLRGRPTPSRQSTLPQSVLDAAGISASVNVDDNTSNEDLEPPPPLPSMMEHTGSRSLTSGLSGLGKRSLSLRETQARGDDVTTDGDEEFRPPRKAWGFLEPGPRLSGYMTSSAPSSPHGEWQDGDPFASAFGRVAKDKPQTFETVSLSD
ncbi:hypothetical protein K435DRAFT_889292 [Dendrothele bispora CBS 962.96]|uniref:REJ domain-containing protein n=1 Tax=Dendrothele bispora (strain CBS 962.96) TaxID=1314807 RepID=A0A4S8M577_DENBC|nr:hypothetical protein K435DRAFT_889292 [Dendrothele bispora CBS 962.96]